MSGVEDAFPRRGVGGFFPPVPGSHLPLRQKKAALPGHRGSGPADVPFSPREAAAKGAGGADRGAAGALQPLCCISPMLGLKSLLPTNGFSPLNQWVFPILEAKTLQQKAEASWARSCRRPQAELGGELGGGSVVGRLIPRALGLPRVFFSLKGNPSKPF